MNVAITDIQLQLVQDGGVQAYASVVLGGEWVLRNLRIIRRADGTFFVSMPNEEVTTRCARCHLTNRATARYCNGCGAAQPAVSDRNFRDLTFPVNSRVRQHFEAVVLEAFVRLSGQAAVTANQDRAVNL